MLSSRHLLGGFATLSVLAFLTGCASVGAPLPPSLELLKPPTDLRAVRKGDRVYLFWTVPSKTMDRQSARHRGPTLICRSLEVAMAGCGTPIGSVTPEPPPENAAKNDGREQATFVDQIPADLVDNRLHDWQSGPVRTVTYAVEALNSSDRSAGLSNQVQIQLAPTVAPPKDFHAELTSEGVRLTWTGELLSLPMSTVNYFYRVYRRLETNERTVIGQVPRGFDARPFLLDQTFAWEKRYQYWMNVVTVVQTGASPCPSTSTEPTAQPCVDHVEIEGDDTPFVSVFTHDIYPPAVPTGLQAVFSGPGQKPFIDLLWAPDTDADLAGYNVYRREEGTPPAKINTELVKAPAYRDPNIVSGKAYWYAVSAVDLRGNESARSDETSESVP